MLSPHEAGEHGQAPCDFGCSRRLLVRHSVGLQGANKDV
jgi:hypothetical protein